MKSCDASVSHHAKLHCRILSPRRRSCNLGLAKASLRILDGCSGLSEKSPIEKAVQVVVAAWSDPVFKSELLTDPRQSLAGLGIEIPQGIELDVRDNDGGVHHVIVCTQCSCWPTFLSPMPPFWKNSEYIARVVADPRIALVEMGLTLDPGEPVKVVDTTPRRRAMVIPRRPPVGEDSAALAPYVNNLNIAGYAK